MGSACCVASRDKAIVTGSGGEVLHRNIRYSPTWSFRWDNRGRVAGEDTSISWFSDGISRNDGSEIKFESAFASEDGSPSDSAQSLTWQKPQISEVNLVRMGTPASGQSISRNMSADVNGEQVKGSTDSPEVSCQSPTKASVSLTSTSSLTTSPLSSQNQQHHVNSTIPKWALHSPEYHLSRQISDSRMSRLKSPYRYSLTEERLLPSWCNEYTGGSRGGSSDGWSMHAFSELMATSRRERWSFDNELWSFSREKRRSSGRISASASTDLQTCGVCTKLLTEKSSWRSNELSVVAVLTCGHVYHAECLENMTPEISKYDPSCPICTLGEKKMQKLSEKALKAELEFKAKSNKRSRNRIVDSDLDDEFIAFDQLKGSVCEGKASSSSTKSSSVKPFLRRHFSFGSKDGKYLSDNNPTRKKGLFWAKSSKM